MTLKQHTFYIAATVSALLFALPAQAILVTFNDLGIVHGTVISSQFNGLTISASNFRSGPDYAVAYDTMPGTGPGKSTDRDADLTGPNWGNTNIQNVNNLQLGNLLIIQETISGQISGCDTGVCEYPDDEGKRPAGSLYFDFNTAITSFGFDLIDVEGPDEFGNNSGYAAVFFDDLGTELAQMGFGSFIARDGALYGNNSVNRIAEINFVSELGLSETDMVTRVEINFGGSAGIDNISYTIAVSEPASLLLLAIGLGGLGLRRRRVTVA